MSILTHTNNNYERYDEDNVLASPQPAFRSESMDAVGWTNFTWKDFDGDYVKTLVGGGITSINEYVKRDVDNNIVTQPQYIRHDIDNNPVGSLNPLEIVGVGNITAPNGFAVGRDMAGQVAGYQGGTEPITVEGQLQKQETPGGAWIGISPWTAVDTAVKEIDSSLVGAKLRISTRIQDAIIAPSYLTTNTPASDVVVGEMTPDVKGTLTSSGADPAYPGDVLTQTEGTITGGIAPFTKSYQWFRRETGTTNAYSFFGAPDGLTYTIQYSDIGYDVKARTRWQDSYNYLRTVGTIPNHIEVIAEPLELVSKGTLDGVGQSGTVLTQTAAVFSGGVPPFTYRYEWVRRVTGESGFFEFGAPDGLQYIIRSSDIGYDIRGRTEIFDSLGNSKSSSSTIPGDVSVTS
ncbi:hypothetical protein Syn7803C9_133 [Synechococcus phage ACG-2014f]|uniref:Uncharacterized protein n=1 Tax=Synechococcus phage ACG-2014f TaxID=1493511 RepID=A0A0E3HFD1_9CAUD|nr:hypothetical protein Syn7803C9_133 [Synechococcus phage ACG-2014f]